MSSINQYIDHTLLKPQATEKDIQDTCSESVDNNFAGCCIPPCFVKDAGQQLGNSQVNLVTVIGFPLGYGKTTIKAEEAKKAIEDGADELDMVMNVAAFKSGSYEYVKEDMKQIIGYGHYYNKTVKTIIEIGLLDENEVIQACKLCSEAKVDYVKTCTGFNGGYANVEAIRLMREHLPESIKIKASGGIKEAQQAMELIEAGADRLGTSSGLKIISHANT